MQASAEAAAEVDTQLAVLKKELALAEDEIIHVPFLHHARAGLLGVSARDGEWRLSRIATCRAGPSRPRHRRTGYLP